ncbi:MAG: TonB-dependent receptor [Candidatus Aenigmarchaeota archaeon]|nr:TonB-dependent receptor [Candidatus Aenigmarchaeota archaeon]
MALMKKIFVLVVFLLVLGICTYSYGQILTGSIRGTVKDEDGSVLPGVTVELRSPVLIGGPKVQVTSERGLFRFANLPPGIYELTFSLEGFQTLKKEGYIVKVDTTTTEDVILRIATVEESITVTAESPVVDVTESGIATSWETDMLDNLPLTRTCFFDLVNSTPGVWSHGGETGASRSVAYGTGSESNTYLFDGVDTTSPDYGAAWAWLNPDVIQEIQVIGIGGKAEYGNFMGATVNIVTKSGGNEFHGGASTLFQFNALTDNNSTAYLKDLVDTGYITEAEKFPYHRQAWRDLSFQLGGPIVKDKIWFFLAAWHQYDASTPTGTDPQYYTVWKDTKLFFKGTFQATKNLKITGFLDYEWFELPDAFTPDYESLDAVGYEHGTAPTASLGLTAVLSNTTFFDLKFNYSGGKDFFESVTGSREPPSYNWDTDISSGGVWWPWYFWPSRVGVNATISHFAEDFIAGDHDFKIGVQYSRGRSDVDGGYVSGATYATYTYYYYYGGYYYPYPYEYKYEMAPYSYGARSSQVSGFLDDTWSISDRLTLNLGLRYDHNTGWIPDMPEINVGPAPNYEWTDSDVIVPGKPGLVKWRVFSPRIGFAFKLTPDGKTLFRANAGRYYDMMTMGNWYLPAPTSTTWSWYWRAAGDVAWNFGGDDPPARVSVDPNLKNPYADQFSVGIDRELFPDFGLSVTYMEKWTKDMIGFEPAVGTWDDYYDLITVSDPLTGDNIQAYNLTGELPEIQITNPDRYYSRFRMISVVANKRMSNNWQLSASFTYSKIWGLNPRGISRQTYSENILWNSSSARDPNHFLNIEGRMPGDRPFTFRFQGTYIFPYGFSASTNVQIMSGAPYARSAKIFGLNQGSQTVAVEARGDNGHRLPTAYLVDFNVAKTFKIADRFSIQARVEVFNLLNQATPTSQMNYSLGAGDEWVWGSIWMPRRVQFGLKVRF